MPLASLMRARVAMMRARNLGSCLHPGCLHPDAKVQESIRPKSVRGDGPIDAWFVRSLDGFYVTLAWLHSPR